MENHQKRTIAEGSYNLSLQGHTQKVQVLSTMQGQWPCTKEILMAHFPPEAPRFPIAVSTLVGWGAELTPA